MTEASTKRFILTLALEAEMQGMIADNKLRESGNLSPAYSGGDFQYIAEQMRELASKHDDEILIL